MSIGEFAFVVAVIFISLVVALLVAAVIEWLIRSMGR